MRTIKYFAQLDDLNQVIGISQLDENAKGDKLIEIDNFDLNLINSIYIPTTKEFKTLKPVPSRQIISGQAKIANYEYEKFDLSEIEFLPLDDIQVSILRIENKIDLLLEQLNIKYE